MGFENNVDFRRAAEDVQAVHDGAQTEGPSATTDQPENDAPQAEDASVSGPSLADVLGSMLLGSVVAAAAAAEADAAESAEDEIFEDAIDAFGVAQTLGEMSTSADAFADQLELNGMLEVAEHVRAAAKSVRKGAKVSRAVAADALTVLKTEG